MNLVISAVVSIFLQTGVAFGQKAQSGPGVPSPAPKMEEVPSGTPEPQTAPDVLPESNQLPAEPPDLRLPSPSVLKPEGSASAVTQLSPEEREKNKAQLEEVRAIATRNARVIDLLKEANAALTDEAKREFLRAYYHTLCTRMRNLKPALGPTITEFERAEIRNLAVGPSRVSFVSRDPQHKERPHHAQRSD
jgi:hypothetical protein